MKYCPKCGFNVENMKFCPKCGLELDENMFNKATIDDETLKADNSKNYDSIDKNQLRAEIVRKNAEHYTQVFESMDKLNNGSWNWCGFLFGPMWFAYRKMYLWSIITFIGPILIGIILAFCMINHLDQFDIVSRCVSLAISIAFGFIANRIYKKRVDDIIEQLPASETARSDYLQKKGGTNPIAMIIMIIIILSYRVFDVYLSTM